MKKIHILFIEGDGIGKEITPVMRSVLDAAVKKCYDSTVALNWEEIYAGEKANELFGTSLPEATVDRIREVGLAIKGPLMTPVGGGIRSLNVGMRQALDLYACVRPVRYFSGVPTPVRHPERVDMVVFRENTEDIYSGIEWMNGTESCKKLEDFLIRELDVRKIRFPESCSLGIKPISKEGSERLVGAAIDYALRNHRKSVTLVHKGNIMKFTEGAFRAWGYQLAKDKYGAMEKDGVIAIERSGEPDLVIKDCIADAFLQNILLRPEEYDVIATMNLNGDYISDALAAQVGGIGISPGANINYECGKAVFEATHGIAPDIAGQNKANPLSIILSGEMLLRHVGLPEAADRILSAIEGTLAEGYVTADFAGILRKEGREAKLLGTREFGDMLISHI